VNKLDITLLRTNLELKKKGGGEFAESVKKKKNSSIEKKRYWRENCFARRRSVYRL